MITKGSSVKSSDENSQLINTRKRIRRCKVTDRYNSEFKNVKDRLVEMDKFDKIKKTRKSIYPCLLNPTFSKNII